MNILSLQETKRDRIDKSLCQALWGDDDVSWEMHPAENTAGGLLCIWNDKRFKVERKVTGRGFILLEGTWINEAQNVCIINVYAPCDTQNKRVLWESLRQQKILCPNVLWCLMGDFNNVRSPLERVGLSQRVVDDRIISEFNDWIADLEVEEPPCVGRKFTWFRPNGAAKSKLDRTFVSAEWFSKWPVSTQFILDRNFSDHCPVLLTSKSVDWGPKPFRVLDCWLKDKSFSKIVHDCWSQTHLGGWGGYVLKEKIKRLKVRLRSWNKEHFGDTFKKVQTLELELNKLESDTADRQLTDQENMRRKQLQ